MLPRIIITSLNSKKWMIDWWNWLTLRVRSIRAGSLWCPTFGWLKCPWRWTWAWRCPQRQLPSQGTLKLSSFITHCIIHWEPSLLSVQCPLCYKPLSKFRVYHHSGVTSAKFLGSWTPSPFFQLHATFLPLAKIWVTLPLTDVICACPRSSGGLIEWCCM